MRKKLPHRNDLYDLLGVLAMTFSFTIMMSLDSIHPMMQVFYIAIIIWFDMLVILIIQDKNKIINKLRRTKQNEIFRI